MKEQRREGLQKYEKAVNILHNPITAWVILGVSLCLTFIAWRISSNFSQQLAKDRFDFRLQEIVTAIEERMSVYEQALRGGVALFNTTGEVSREKWRDYVTSLDIDQHWPGIQGIGYSVPVAKEERYAHIEAIKAEGFKDFVIKPEGDREEYSSIIYLEPFDWRNQRAFGYDMWSNPMRREAMKRARDTGDPATSGIITLVQETEKNIQKGFLTYLPVYEKGKPTHTLEERRAAFKGWVYAPFRAGDLMKGVIGTADLNYDFEIYDGTEITAEALLFDSDTTHHLSQLEAPAFSEKIPLKIQGRDWLVYVHTNQLSAETKEAMLPQMVAIGGVVVDLLLFYVIFAMYHLNKKAKRIAGQMTATMQRERQLLRRIIDNIPINIYVKNKNLKKTLANKAEYEYMGFRSEREALGKCDRDIYDQESVRISEEEDRMILDGHPFLNRETINRRLDGGGTHFLSSKFPLISDGDTIEGILGISIDISERKAFENELLRVKEMLAQTNRVAKVGGWEVNMQTQEVFWSDMMLAIYELDPDFQPKVGDFASFIESEEMRDRLSAAIKVAKMTKEGWDMELEIVTTKGNRRWVRSIGQADFAEGSCIRLYGTVQDISLQKYAQLELEKAKLRLELATNAAKVGIWEFNIQENRLCWDRQMYELYGIRENDFAAVYEAWTSALHPEDAARAQKEGELAMVDGKDYDTEFRIIWPNGEVRYIKAMAEVGRDEQGNPLYMIGTNWDITPSKRLEDHLINARNRAEDANTAKSEFLANMSHEIRTPLNSVIGFSDLLMKTELNKSQQLYLKSINESGIILLDLINDILDFSKIEAGKLQLVPDKVNLLELSSNIMEVVRYKANEKGLELLLHIDEKVSTHVWVDPVRLKQVLINILGNAIKFTKTGEVELSIECIRPLDEEGNTILRFSIRDTGIGISEDKQQLIFDAFSQEDYSTTRKYGGTGLGLSISDQLLGLMGTGLKLQSKVGEGSLFHFEVELMGEKEPTMRVELTKHPWKKALIIEDSKRAAIILQELLLRNGIESEYCINGSEALRSLQSKQYDLLWVDYSIPYFNGLDIIEKIAENQALPPTFLLVNHMEKEDIHMRAKSLGVTKVLNKPMHPLAISSALLQLARGEDKLGKQAMRHTNHRRGSNVGSLDRPKVLLVDDNPINMLLAKSIFENMMPEALLLEASNGKQAVELYTQYMPQIVIMDIQMPIMSGYEATYEIRKYEKEQGLSEVPIIALTAGTVKGERERCEQAGMNDYMSKPIVAESLINALGKWMKDSIPTES